ncbi:MAG: carbohydrate kinase family protein [Hyphomicrobiaceae bacterium]
MKALTIGSAMIDTIAIIESSRIERMTMLNAETSFLLLAEGHKTEALEISTHTGGGAVNTAVAMARLGVDVATLAKLGRDQRAETILAGLMQEGVSTRWIGRDDRAATGAAVMISSHERNAAIFTFRGANTLLEDGDLKPDAFAVDLVHVSSLSNQSADRLPRILAEAKRTGAFLSVNPGIRQLSSRGGALQDALADIDLLVVNKIEASALVPIIAGRIGEGGPPLGPDSEEPPSALARQGLTGGGYQLGLRAFFTALRDAGARYVLVTDGAAGSFLADRAHIRFCPAAPPAVVAGTAGAGDAYAATLATFLAEGRAPEDAMRAAALNAASVVGFIDTQRGLLGRAALNAALAATGSRLAISKWPI